MEVIRAILMIALSVMFFFLVVQFLWPLFLIIGAIILYNVYKFKKGARNFEKAVKEEERVFRNERSQYQEGHSVHSDVIDVEFTEEEIK